MIRAPGRVATSGRVRDVGGAVRATASEALGRVELLRDLEPDVLAHLACRVQARSWQPGELVVEQDAPGESLIVLVRGTVTVYHQAPDGARAALAHLRAPTTLGEVTLFDGAPRSATVQAVEPCEGLELHRVDLLDLLRDEPRFLDALLCALGALVRRLSEQAADQVLLDLPGRVAKTLVTLAEGPSDIPIVHLSQTRIAELAGGSRQSLNQVLRRFAERGLVRVESGGIVVCDLPALRRRAGLRDDHGCSTAESG
jgi:CRP/FNR family cyclic AMP-dependent transcriptional regulator